MLNINDIQTLKEITYEILHPVTGEKLGASVTLLGDSHNDRREAVREYNRSLRKIGEGDSQDQVELRREAHMLYISACITGWTGIADDGKEIEFSRKAVIEVLQRPELDWMLGQVSMALIEQKNFIAAQPKA